MNSFIIYDPKNLCISNIKMDTLFLSKIYEEKGYDEFVQCLEMANKVDEDKLTTFTTEQLIAKIHFLQKSNDIMKEEIQKIKSVPSIISPKVIEPSQKSKDYAQALLSILHKKPEVQSPKEVNMKKNIIMEVLRMETTYKNMETRIKTLKIGTNEYMRMRTEMNKMEKEMSILISRMATFARKGHEASKVPEERSPTVGSFEDGTDVKLHRLTRNLFTEDIMDENGDILNVDFIKFYYTYDKKMGKFDVIWYSLTEDGIHHFEKCLEDPSLRKFVNLASFDLLDQIVPVKQTKK